MSLGVCMIYLSEFGLAFVRLAGSSKQAYQWMALISAVAEAL